MGRQGARSTVGMAQGPSGKVAALFPGCVGPIHGTPAVGVGLFGTI